MEWFKDLFGSQDKDEKYVDGSAMDNFGKTVKVGSDLFGMYNDFSKAGAYKDNAKLAKQDMLFNTQMAMAGAQQGLDVNMRKNLWAGGTGQGYSLGQYLPQSTLDTYGMGHLGTQGNLFNNQAPQGNPQGNPALQQPVPQQPLYAAAPNAAVGNNNMYGGFGGNSSVANIPPANPSSPSGTMNYGSNQDVHRQDNYGNRRVS